MNSFISAMSTDDSKTYNGAITHSSSNSDIIDMFFLFGALRNKPDDDIKTVFNAALREDANAAIKLLAYFRDIEKGSGERRVFRVSLQYLYDNNMIDYLNRIMLNIEPLICNNIARTDDFIWLANYIIERSGMKSNPIIDNVIESMYNLMYNSDIKGIVAKWMPRKGSKYDKVVKYMRKFGFIKTYSIYRKLIVELSKTVEQDMSAKRWKKIDLSKISSLAMKKYKKAFDRHGLLKPYLEKLAKGEAKINAKRLTPGDVVKDIIKILYGGKGNTNDIELLNHQWNNLKTLDSLPKEFRALPMIDVSGSMMSPDYNPISNSVGIGLFMAENNPNEVFKDYFITFTDDPYFQKISGHDICSKVENAMEEVGYNTNIAKAFDLVLSKSLEANVPADEMPTHIVIISDMEFDDIDIGGNSVGALKMMDKKYQSHGYERPQIVFWNVNGRIGNVPAKDDDNNVILISGNSQNAINFILKKQYEDVYGIIDEIVNDERYSFI